MRHANDRDKSLEPLILNWYYIIHIIIILNTDSYLLLLYQMHYTII